MPLTIDSTIDLPVTKQPDGNLLNDPNWIDPNTKQPTVDAVNRARKRNYIVTHFN